MMPESYYYPITDYHIILCHLFRKYYGGRSHNLILDESLLRQETFYRLKAAKGWNEVNVIKKLPTCQKFFDRNVFCRANYKKIFDANDANFVFFSFGIDFINNIINSIFNNNCICLAEDGVFPYYGLGVIDTYFKKLPNEPVKVKLKRFLLQYLNRKNRFDVAKINKLLVIKPRWLPHDLQQEYCIDAVTLGIDEVMSVFDELNTLYQYEKKVTHQNLDVVFFDSGITYAGAITEAEEHRVLCKIFEKLYDKKIFIKLRSSSDGVMQRRADFYRSIQERTTAKIIVDIEESQYPWEIIYYNHMASLQDAAFMCASFTTAFFSPNVFFGAKNRMICLSNFFADIAPSTNADFTALVERINGDVTAGTVLFPEDPSSLASCLTT